MQQHKFTFVINQGKSKFLRHGKSNGCLQESRAALQNRTQIYQWNLLKRCKGTQHNQFTLVRNQGVTKCLTHGESNEFP